MAFPPVSQQHTTVHAARGLSTIGADCLSAVCTSRRDAPTLLDSFRTELSICHAWTLILSSHCPSYVLELDCPTSLELEFAAMRCTGQIIQKIMVGNLSHRMESSLSSAGFMGSLLWHDCSLTWQNRLKVSLKKSNNPFKIDAHNTVALG